jgi:hypothetical protein
MNERERLSRGCMVWTNLLRGRQLTDQERETLVSYFDRLENFLDDEQQAIDRFFCDASKGSTDDD